MTASMIKKENRRDEPRPGSRRWNTSTTTYIMRKTKETTHQLFQALATDNEGEEEEEEEGTNKRNQNPKLFLTL
jgi:hypothetical protein